MANKAHNGLGRGLDALFGTVRPGPQPPSPGEAVQEIEVEAIRANRFQPRQEFDEAALEELKESIRSYGVLQPVLVRKLPDGGFELIAGERRLRAAKLAGVKEIPALVKEYNDVEISEISLIENIQREDLNAMEEARAYERLMTEFHLTQEAMAGKLGRSRSHIANMLRLLKLAPKVQDYVSNGSLSMGQARPLLALEDGSMQCEIADIIQEQDLSARQAEALVKRIQAGDRPSPPPENPGKEEQAIYLQDAEERLRRYLGTQVRIRNGRKKSRIEIEFYSEEDLERILQNLAPGEGKEQEQELENRRTSQPQMLTV